MLGFYLMFNRNCAEALDVYSQAFNVKVKEKQTFGEKIQQNNAGFPFAKEDLDLIVYSKIKIGSTRIICLDSSERSLPGLNMCISVKEDEIKVKKAWQILLNGGKIYYDLAPTSFAILHGSLQDKFGVNWIFTVPNPKQPEPKKGSAKAKVPVKKNAKPSKVKPESVEPKKSPPIRFE